MKKVSNKNTIFYPNVLYVRMELNFNFPMNESLKFLLVCFFQGKYTLLDIIKIVLCSVKYIKKDCFTV